MPNDAKYFFLIWWIFLKTQVYTFDKKWLQFNLNFEIYVMYNVSFTGVNFDFNI